MKKPLPIRGSLSAALVTIALLALVALAVAATATAAGASTSPAASRPAAAMGELRVPPEGVVAVGLLGAVAFVAASAERRRRQDAAGPGDAAASEPEEPPLDEDTIGTIEYASPSAELDDQETDEGRD